MKIKICGMKFPGNITEVGALNPDYIGFIFYPKSKRYVGEDFSVKAIESLPKTIKKTGVFVNESLNEVLEKIVRYELDAVQLHGNEPVEECRILKKYGVEVIKAFSVNEGFDFESLKSFETVCDYFLFDTPISDYGGSGQEFNWQLLEKYTLSKPFFLSGGIGLENINKAMKINHPMLIGFDCNSQLEGVDYKKDIEKVTDLIIQIRTK